MSSSKKTPKVGLWALFLKLGPKILSFLAKAFKLSKLGLAAVSFASYAVLFSWKFAILLMIAIGWHESGHVWAMRRMGVPTKGWYFLPFLGGVAVASGDYKSYGRHAYIAIMGPIWGLALAFLTAGIYWMTGNPLWAAAAAFMAAVNLFNLLPIVPLDGGQLLQTIAFSLHKNIGLVFLFVSLVICGFVMWEMHSILFVLLLVVGFLELLGEAHKRIKLRKYERGEIEKFQLPSSMIQPNGEVKTHPIAMSKWQLLLTAFSFGGTVFMLFLLLALLKHVPGADLAANFFN